MDYKKKKKKKCIGRHPAVHGAASVHKEGECWRGDKKGGEAERKVAALPLDTSC